MPQDSESPQCVPARQFVLNLEQFCEEVKTVLPHKGLLMIAAVLLSVALIRVQGLQLSSVGVNSVDKNGPNVI